MSTPTISWRTYADPDWVRFAGAEWLERIMSVDVRDRLHTKQGRSIARWTLSEGNDTLVVYLKRHFTLPRRDTILARLMPWQSRSPGWQEFQHLHWARENGLPVPRILAAGETRSGPLQSFLVVEELTGMLALHEAIPLAAKQLSAREFETWKRGLVKELARLTRELHRRKAYHQDLYLCHFYILESDTLTPECHWPGRVVMIDFHRLAVRPWARKYHQIKDLAQLLFSTVGVTGLTDRDAMRFRRAYHDGKNSRWLDRAIRAKAERYTQHNQKSTTGPTS
jgi:tRNA A-37 threonylcarbamoyl transferase component Bud32